MKRSLALWSTMMAFLFLMYGISMAVLNNNAEYDQEIAGLKANNVMLTTAVNYMQDVQLELQEEAIYGWPIHLEDYIRITSEYGYRHLLNTNTGGSSSSEHKGLDLIGFPHARVTAVSDGTVVDHYPPPSRRFKGHPILGGMIKLKHTDGTYSVYGHLSSTYVSEYGVGKYVTAGQVIGRTGNTGQSQGEHLHFELRDVDDEATQPLLYLKDPQRIN